ncbi:MAG: hypothetical protein JJ895_15505 [Balneolaceae bacterium]|nr:hypothetical protein [Balneolaceae bacterium]
MSLQELHINNFKFFREVDQDSPLLKINGRHVLIYGENGSGKSTIYWALYTLLEASFKKNDIDIKKYFYKRNKHSLVNIHIPTGQDAFINAVVEDSQGNNVDYKVSRTFLNIKGDSDVMESNMASDFINYRILFQLHNRKHSKIVDLFPWFYEEVLPYVRKDATPCLEEFEEFKNGPSKVKDIHGNDVYPVASLRKSKDPAEKNNYQVYKDYKNKVRVWNVWLGDFLENTSQIANQLLQNHFKYNFRFEFDFKPIKFNTEEYKFEFEQPEIRIKIPEYNGQTTTRIKKPHTFLNEAKWSAIGLTIRFAILDIKLYQADMKCLVIDDMLLSLDMKHRYNVLDLLLNQYANDFQLIMMTHDRHFYELSKSKINALNQSSDWLKFEMYEDKVQTGERPLLIESKTNLEKAISFYKQKEFAASANHLRKATEKFVEKFVPLADQYNRNYVKLDLASLLSKAKTEASNQGWPQNLISQIDLVRRTLFNPQSHYDVKNPIFQGEVQSGIDLIKEVVNRTGFRL